MASTEGGVDIEKVAHETPEKILKATIDPLVGVQPYQGRELAFQLGLQGEQIEQFAHIFVSACTKLFNENDLALLEINPLVIMNDGNLHCAGRQDQHRRQRHVPPARTCVAMRDQSQDDATEAPAPKCDLNYVALDGNIGCMVNGAGLAMATMDIIKLYGGEPANFLDVGGGATKERVTEAFKIILSDSKVAGRPGEHLRRHRALRHDRRRHHRRREGSRRQGAGGGASGRHQCRAGARSRWPTAGLNIIAADSLADAAAARSSKARGGLSK